jgi:hypothetical protein
LAGLKLWTSQVVRITDVSHQRPALGFLFSYFHTNFWAETQMLSVSLLHQDCWQPDCLCVSVSMYPRPFCAHQCLGSSQLQSGTSLHCNLLDIYLAQCQTAWVLRIPADEVLSFNRLGGEGSQERWGRRQAM